MKKILVTGGTGRVGCNLVKALAERGDRVRALVMPNDPKRSKLDGMDVEISEADLTDEEGISKAVEGVEAVIHTACIMHRKGDEPPMPIYFDVNVKGTMFLLEAATRNIDKVEKFVYMSSDAVYPVAYAAYYTPVDEGHPKHPMDEYGMIKVVCESMVLTYLRQHGLRTTIVRPSAVACCDEVLGGWTANTLLAVTRRAVRARRSTLNNPDMLAACEKAVQETERKLCVCTGPGGAPALWNKTDVRDVVHGAICALDSDASVGEDFNITGPAPSPFTVAVPLIADKTGQDYTEYEFPVQWRYMLDNTKAKLMIGYQPQYDITRMIENAIAFKNGEDIGVIPA